METGFSPDKQGLSVDVITEGKPNTLKKNLTTSSKQQEIRCFCQAFWARKSNIGSEPCGFHNVLKEAPNYIISLKNSTVNGFHIDCPVFNGRR